MPHNTVKLLNLERVDTRVARVAEVYTKAQEETSLGYLIQLAPHANHDIELIVPKERSIELTRLFNINSPHDLAGRFVRAYYSGRNIIDLEPRETNAEDLTQQIHSASQITK